MSYPMGKTVIGHTQSSTQRHNTRRPILLLLPLCYQQKIMQSVLILNPHNSVICDKKPCTNF